MLINTHFKQWADAKTVKLENKLVRIVAFFVMHTKEKRQDLFIDLLNDYFLYLFVTFSVYLSDIKYLKLWKIQNANVQTVNVPYVIVEIAKKATVLA